MSGAGLLPLRDPLLRQALLFSLAVHLATLSWVQTPIWETASLVVIDARLDALPEPGVQSPKPVPMRMPVQTIVPPLPAPLPAPLPMTHPPASVVPVPVITPIPIQTPAAAVFSPTPTAFVQPRSPTLVLALAMMAVAETGVSEAARVLPDAVWYPVSKLDTIPKRLGTEKPPYPANAQQRGGVYMAGSVKVKLQVNALGEVEAVEIVSAQPEGVFDATVQTFFKMARYQPPQREGRPVRAIIEERIRFVPPEEF